MALQLADRVQVSATANTTVSFTLGSAVAGYQSFTTAGIVNGNTVFYGSSDSTNWEIGIGTYSSTGPTLTRTTILSSSNAGAAVTFSGTPVVWIDYPAETSIYSPTSGGLTSGYVPYGSGSGVLNTSSNFTFNGSTLTTLGNYSPSTWATTGSYVASGPYGGVISFVNTSGSSDGFSLALTGTPSQLNFYYGASGGSASGVAALTSVGAFSTSSNINAAGYISTNPSNQGQVRLTPSGNTTNSGYVSFFDTTSSTRLGYVGYATIAGNGTLTLATDGTNALNFSTNATLRMTITSGGNVLLPYGAGQFIQGDFDNATVTSRTQFQTQTTNATTGIYAVPNGTSGAASWQAANNSSLTNASKILIATNGTTDVQLVSGINGAGTYLPLSFYNNGSQQAQLQTTGTWTYTATTQSGTSNLSQASAGFMNFAARSVAGKLTPTWRGPSGLPYYAQAGIGNMQWQELYSPGNTTSNLSVIRCNAPTTTGTLTSRTVASTNTLTRARRLGFVSSATAGNFGYEYEPTVAQFTVGDGSGNGGFYFVARFGISDAATVSGARMFIGLTSSIAAPTNVEPSTLTNAIGIAQLSTDATQLYVVYGGSAAQTAVAVGTNFPATAASSNWFEFIMYAPGNSQTTVYWQINNLTTGNTNQGTLTAAVAGTQLPAASTFLAQRAWRCNNATALAVGLDIGSIYIETDI